MIKSDIPAAEMVGLFDKMNGLFAELFSRVVPLVCAPVAYRESVAKQELKFRRRVSCECLAGCERCGLVRWRVVDESLVIHVPATAEFGTRLRLKGKGDERLERFEDLEVELVEPGTRADELAQRSLAYEEALVKQWSAECEAKAAEQRAVRRQRRTALVVIAGIGVVAAVIGVVNARPGMRHEPEASVRTTSAPIAAMPSVTADAPNRVIEAAPLRQLFGTPASVASVLEAPANLNLRFLAAEIAEAYAAPASLPAPLWSDPNASIWRRTDMALVQDGAHQVSVFARATDRDGHTLRAFGMPFWVRQITANRAPLAAPPWHAPGGSWTYLDAQFGAARVLFGMNTKRAPMPNMPTYESGDILAAPADAKSATEFAAQLGRYLHAKEQGADSARSAAPLNKIAAVRGRIGVLGQALHRSSLTGAYETSDTPGPWTLAKLTFETADDLAELYLAFDAEDRIGELTEKEPECRAPLAKLFGARSAR